MAYNKALHLTAIPLRSIATGELYRYLSLRTKNGKKEKTMKCPKCGLENPEEASSCSCGYDLSSCQMIEASQQSTQEAGPVLKPSKIEAKASWSEALFWGGIAGLLFRSGLIISSSGRGWGIILTGIGFLVGLIAWGMKPFYKPFLGVLLGFALADGASAILHLHR